MNNSVITGTNGEYSKIDMQQRRACALFKNNPSMVLNCSVNTFTGVPLGGPINPNMGGYEDAPGTKYDQPEIPIGMSIINKPEYKHEAIVEPSSPETLDTLEKENPEPEPGAQLPMNLNGIENFSVSYSSFRTIFVLVLHLVALIVLIFLIWKYT